MKTFRFDSQTNKSLAKKSLARTSLRLSGAVVLGVSFALSGILAGCGDKTATKTNASSTGNERSAYETTTDHAMGNPKAPITVVEYASVTCSHCANWHETVYPEFKTKYVDTGKVRYVYRPFPTPPVDLANAGHLLANCAPNNKFFDLISIQMKRQKQIFGSSDIKGEYIAMAKSAGMSEDDFDKCMQNEELMDRLQKIIEMGVNDGVTGTPTFFINGKKVKAFTIEDFDKEFAVVLGLPAPKTDAKTDSNKDDTKSEDKESEEKGH